LLIPWRFDIKKNLYNLAYLFECVVIIKRG
jgi:hypothetical protein